MAKSLHIENYLDEKINFISNAMNQSATALITFLLDKSTDKIMELLPELEKKIKEDEALTAAFKFALALHRDIKRGSSYETAFKKTYRNYSNYLNKKKIKV